MINRTTNQGQAVITICKYDDYQIAYDAINQASGGSINQRSTSDQPELKKGNKGNKREGAPARDRAVPFPEGFSLDAAMERFAAERGFPPVEARRMFEQFCNHHQSKGSRFVSWTAAWQKWVGNQVEFRQQRGPMRRSGTPDV